MGWGSVWFVLGGALLGGLYGLFVWYRGKKNKK